MTTWKGTENPLTSTITWRDTRTYPSGALRYSGIPVNVHIRLDAETCHTTALTVILGLARESLLSSTAKQLRFTLQKYQNISSPY